MSTFAGIGFSKRLGILIEYVRSLHNFLIPDFNPGIEKCKERS